MAARGEPRRTRLRLVLASCSLTSPYLVLPVSADDTYSALSAIYTATDPARWDTTRKWLEDDYCKWIYV